MLRYSVVLLDLPAEYGLLLLLPTQMLVLLEGLRLAEGVNGGILHLDVDCMGRRVHRLPAGPF
jgi:hypothetical protein